MIIYNITDEIFMTDIVEPETLLSGKPHPTRTRIVSYATGPGEGVDSESHPELASQLEEFNREWENQPDLVSEDIKADNAERYAAIKELT